MRWLASLKTPLIAMQNRISTNTNLLCLYRNGGRRKMNEIIPLLAEGGYKDLDLNFCEMMNPVSLLKEEDSAEPYILELLSLKEKYKLNYHQCHLPYTADFLSLSDNVKELHLKNIKLAIKYSERLGIKTLVIHPIKGSIEDNLCYFKRIIPSLKAGMMLAIENMEREDEIYSAEDLIDLADTLGTGICLDTGHANMMGLDIPAFIEKCGERLIATHIADNNGLEDQHMLPGFGNIDWENIIPAFRKHYSGFLNYEAMFYGRNLGKEQYGLVIDNSLKCAEFIFNL